MHAGTSCLHKQLLWKLHKHTHPKTDQSLLEALPYFKGGKIKERKAILDLGGCMSSQCI